MPSTPATRKPKNTGYSPEHTREKLLAAAEKIFSRKGYSGTSVKDLADEAGVNVSLVSYHFGGKEGLYKSCLETLGKERLVVVRRILEAPGSLEEFKLRLRMLLDEILRFHLEKRDLISILHRELDLTIPLTNDIFKETFLKVFATLIEFFETAKKNGILRADVDAMTTGSMLFFGVTTIGLRDPVNRKFFGKSIADPQYRQLIIDQAIELYTRGCVVERIHRGSV